MPIFFKEHYGIEVPTSSARNITETHALKIRENECLGTEIPDQTGVERIVVEDGWKHDSDCDHGCHSFR